MPAIRRSGGDAGCDADTDVIEPTEFLHHRIDLLSICSPRIEDRFRVVENYQHLLVGQKWIKASQILGIFDTRTSDFGEPAKEMSTRG